MLLLPVLFRPHDVHPLLPQGIREAVQHRMFRLTDLARILGPDSGELASVVLKLCMVEEQIRETKEELEKGEVSSQPKRASGGL